MNEEVKEVAGKLSDYANAEKEKLIKNIRSESIIGTTAIVVYGVLEVSGAMERSANDYRNGCGILRCCNTEIVFEQCVGLVKNHPTVI